MLSCQMTDQEGPRSPILGSLLFLHYINAPHQPVTSSKSLFAYDFDLYCEITNDLDSPILQYDINPTSDSIDS